MKEHWIRVWCMSARYIYKQAGDNFGDAVSKLKRRGMPDMRGWNGIETEPDDEE